MRPAPIWIPVLLLLAGSAFGSETASSESATPGTVDLPQVEHAAPIARPLAWAEFRRRHDWRVMWDDATGSPHRAFGPAISLARSISDPVAADAAVRGFIADQAALLGSPTLELVSAKRARDLWYVRYREVVDGVPVLFADWEFRLGANGNLCMFGADARPPAAAQPNTRPILTETAARAVAIAGLEFREATDRVEDGARLALLPYPSAAGVEYRLVYEVRVATEEPFARWIVLVDATSGEVLWRRDRVRFEMSGIVSGEVHQAEVGDTPERRGFPHMYVDVAGVRDTTDTSGAYDVLLSGKLPVAAKPSGRYARVLNGLAPRADFKKLVIAPTVLDIEWTDDNSIMAERNAYYHTNAAHDYIVALDPSVTALDYEMPVTVNARSGCNAFWDGLGIGFYTGGQGCVNPATLPDIVYHEYGHGINDMVYLAHGAPHGLGNTSLDEGLADVTSCFMRDDSHIGKGLFGVGTEVRNIDGVRRWPYDSDLDQHITSLIFSGAFWELRQVLGLEAAERLAHFARYGIPDDASAVRAMGEYFAETLLADDDDADLSNGTPHSDAILAAFNRRSIGTGTFLSVQHTALTDQPTRGPFPIFATVQYGSPIGTLDPSTILLRYSISDGPWIAVPMIATGNPDEYYADLPSPEAAIVRYTIEATDSYDQRQMTPSQWPVARVNSLLAGPAFSQYVNALENNPNWLTSYLGDNAIAGHWVVGVPVGSNAGLIQIQPSFDHTDWGQQCYVTGNATALRDPPNANDVDYGRTSLVTTTFDATGIAFPVIEYYRWYSCDASGPNVQDFWRTYVSNDDGLTWSNVENTNVSDNTWQRVMFFVEKYVQPTNLMRVRFVAQDSAAQNILEAAVDDLQLWGFPANVDVTPGPERVKKLALEPAAPNPFPRRTQFRFTLASTGRAELDVYDIHGRHVRRLIAADLEAGEHSAEWDGRDLTGHLAAPGPYFVRLASGGKEKIQKVIRIE